MKNFLTLIIACFLFTFANGQSVEAEKQKVQSSSAPAFIVDENNNVIETTKPVMAFGMESHDFGEVPEGEKYSHEFTFTNNGKEPLIISNVKASCGCTTPEWPKEPIMPGETSAITAVYNSKGRPGPFNKSITITSNAYTPTKRLFIKGKVTSPFEMEEGPAKTKSIVNE